MAFSRLRASVTYVNPKTKATVEFPVAKVEWIDIKISASLDIRGLNPTISFAVNVSEQNFLSFTKNLADVFTPVDSGLSFLVSKSLANSVVPTDDFLGAANPDDDQTMSFTKTLSDVSSISAVIDAVDLSKLLDDSQSVVDDDTFIFDKALTDTPSVIDVDTFLLDKSITDSSTPSEQLTNSLTKALTDSSSQSDSGTIVHLTYCDATYFDDPTYVGATSTF